MDANLLQSRACSRCSQLKVRCLPSPADCNVCERCRHAGRQCVPAGKRRRPRDRIAELEAQVARLKTELQSQRTASHALNVAADDGRSFGFGQRAASLPRHKKHEHQSTGSEAIDFLDSRVSISIQQQALNKYIQYFFPMLPAFTLTDSNLKTLRREEPVLLFSILSFATSYLLPTKTQNELIGQAMSIFASELISVPNRRLELVWALLVAAFWLRAQTGISHVTVHQLIQLAIEMAIDIGLGGNQIPAAPGAGESKNYQGNFPGVQLAWLACFLGASTLSIAIRRREALVQWTGHHENCLTRLSQMASMEQTPPLFLHVIRGEELCHRIARFWTMCDPGHIADFTCDESQQFISSMRKTIDDWTAESRVGGDDEPVLFYRYSAIIYLNEPALHTLTNKLTFGTPLRPEKMAESDFPRPIASGKHVTALYTLRDSCHSMLDLAIQPAKTLFLATCPLSYVSRVSYALFVLAKLYVSVTGPGNTYGAVLRPAELQFEHYLQCMSTTAASVKELNPGSFNERILSCYTSLSDWFKGYTTCMEGLRTDGLSITRSLHDVRGIDSLTSPAICSEQSGPSRELDLSAIDNYYAWMDEFVPDDLFSFT